MLFVGIVAQTIVDSQCRDPNRFDQEHHSGPDVCQDIISDFHGTKYEAKDNQILLPISQFFFVVPMI